jgi:hypothetical protein
MMPRAVVVVLATLLLVACTRGGSRGAFTEPTRSPTPMTPAHLDIQALRALREKLVSALGAHMIGGHLQPYWGGGPPFTIAGPYRDQAASVDAFDLLAQRSLAPQVEGPARLSRDAMAALVAAEYRDLTGPQGGAYLLLARLAPPGTSSPCPSPAPAGLSCLGAGFSDALKSGWYAPDSKSFFHVGDTTTVYRPVDAIALGCALVVAGYGEHNDDKIGAGSDIVAKEMGADFDQHFGLVYGLMTATPRGSRQATDSSTRLSDQVGIAEVLLQAFDASREQQYLADARRALQPILDDRAGLRGDSGFVSGFDLAGAGASGGPVDIETGLLALAAARHYDRDDGGRFARLEERAADAVLASAAQVDAAQGLPASTLAGATSPRSGLVTALAVVVLSDVLSNPPGASPAVPGSPSPGAGSS